MYLSDWFHSSSESFACLRGLGSSVSSSTPPNAKRTPTSRRKSADAYDLGVDGPKQVRLHAYRVWGKEKMLKC